MINLQKVLALAALSLSVMITTFVSNVEAHQSSDGKVYKTVHADGSITYSDQATPNAIEVELNVPTSTFVSGNANPPPKTIVTTKAKVTYSLKIVKPQNEATIRNSAGEVSIVAALEPSIGGLFELSINNIIHQSSTGTFNLTSMNRGAYQYTVKFIDNSGKVIAFTEPRNLYLHQSSALIN